MSKFVGYTQNKRKTPFQIITLVLFVAAVLFLVWLVSIDPAKVNDSGLAEEVVTTSQGNASSVAPATTIKRETGKALVLAQKFATEIKDNWPIKTATKFSANQKIYYHTAIEAQNVPLAIKHVWFDPIGERYFSIDLTIRRQPGGTWSMITMPPGKTGKWTVKTLINGKVLAEKSFTVK